MPRKLLSAICVILVLGTVGCSLSQSMGPKKHPNRFEMEGLVNAYVSPNGIHDYDGHIIYLGLFNKSLRRGEFLSFELWPLTGLGIGFVGVRFQLLPLEIGLGALAYDPKPPSDYSKPEPPEEKPAETKPEPKKETDQ